MCEEWIVQAEGLVKRFRGKGGNEDIYALDHLDLTLDRGCLTAMIGPDGAGKTTLMRLIAGLMVPTKGKLRVFGLDINGHEQEIQNRISYMPQKFGLYEDLTVQENMNLYAELHGVPQNERSKRFKHLLDMMGLLQFTARRAGNLSGGMKQKLELACTLVRSPELLLLDEPTVGVDPLSRRELWEILQLLVKEEHLSVFVNTAYMDEAELCQQVYVINHGQLLKHGKPQDICAVAKERCYYMEPYAGTPARILQSILLDDKQHVVDSVPEGHHVRFIRQANTDIEYFKKKFGLQVQAAKERLEDGFMILLHDDHSERKDEIENFKELSLNDEYPISEHIDIDVRELVRTFGDFTAVAQTSFQVHRGEVFGLLGPNGAGKTTTFRMLCGLLPISGGHLSVAGVNLRTARTQARANIGYVAQKFSLYGNLTVLENLSFFGGAYGLGGKKLQERIRAVINEFHLEGKENAKAGDLPGGYKQRLSMATALLHDPKILFLDEPTSGIDPLARRDFWRQITDLSAKGTTIIITTHFMEEAEYCDRMMIQDHGKLLAIGTPQHIREENVNDEATMNEVFITIVEKARAREEGAA